MEYKGQYTVIGAPGTGKTTYLSGQVRKLADSSGWNGSEDSSPVLVVSLTKAAAREIASRDLPIPDGAVSTLHSQGYRQQGRPPMVTAQMVENEWNDKFDWPLSLDQFKGGGGGDDLMNEDRHEETEGDSIFFKYDLARHSLVEPEGDARDFGEEWTKFKARLGVIDFTDMIEGAGPAPPMGAEYIVVDEAQDMSPLEVRTIKCWAQGKALFCCGDPRQALYTWRGADPMWLVTEDGSHRRVLPKSYRLPRLIKDTCENWAMKLGDWTRYEYEPRDEPGIVRRFPAGIYSAYDVVAEADKVAQSGRTAMIAASCGYHLNGVLSQLRDTAVPFANPWRTKRAQWNPLGYKKGVTMAQRLISLQTPVHSGRMWSAASVYEWTLPMESDKVLVRGAKKAIELTAGAKGSEPVTFDELAQWFQGDRMNELWALAMEKRDGPKLIQWWVSNLLKSRVRTAAYSAHVYKARGLDALTASPRVFIGTVHSFKGSEADVVFLFPDLSPAGWRGWESGHGEGYDSVVRTFYVGMSRAKHELNLCDGTLSGVQWSA